MKDELAKLVAETLKEHVIDPEIPWHCSCNVGLGSHADPDLEDHHRAHVANVILDVIGQKLAEEILS